MKTDNAPAIKMCTDLLTPQRALVFNDVNWVAPLKLIIHIVTSGQNVHVIAVSTFFNFLFFIKVNELDRF